MYGGWLWQQQRQAQRERMMSVWCDGDGEHMVSVEDRGWVCSVTAMSEMINSPVRSASVCLVQIFDCVPPANLMHLHPHPHVCTCTCTYTHTSAPTCTYTCMHLHLHLHSHTHTYVCTCMYPCTHMYTCTCIYAHTASALAHTSIHKIGMRSKDLHPYNGVVQSN